MIIAGALTTASLLPSADVRVMMRNARHIVAQSGDRVWRGYSGTPLPVLLVEPARETLFCSSAVDGFTAAATDPITGCSTQTRPRELPVDVSAADDLQNRLVIQIGLPDAVAVSGTEWIVTLLHESFHEYQSMLPRHREAVSRVSHLLGGAGGSWALDYPFPYTDPRVTTAFAEMNACALAFLAAPRDQDVRTLVTCYVHARRKAQAIVGEPAWKYYEFQVGEEGVARWTEIKLARIAGETDGNIAALANDRWGGLSTSLRSISSTGLSKWKRSSFYVFGAVEAEMLERLNPSWHEEYRKAPFTLGTLLDVAVTPHDE